MEEYIEEIKQAIDLLHKENMAILQFFGVVLQVQGVPYKEIHRITHEIEKEANKTESLFITKGD